MLGQNLHFSSVVFLSGVVKGGGGRPERHLSKGRHTVVSTNFGLS